MKILKGYIVSLWDPEFIPTGLRTAAFVGSLLFLINHGPALLRREMTSERWISTVLTYTMPYLVNVYGQYSYRRKISCKELSIEMKT
ncbi:nitrate/nitrite transporter NrtS [Leptothermofonsia sp. ETS-13]|uniref:nitrate/nitrite transporter NrtS n=1 Tax=Leptothermofonsia sp. ETS-13 TaxID=3035696 RepID=UPI003BA0E92F